MYRLGIGITGINAIGSMSGTAIIEKDEPYTSEKNMFIQVIA